MRKIFFWFLIFFSVLAIVLGPNILWLSNSTLKISNNYAQNIKGIEIEFRGGKIAIASLKFGTDKFIFLTVKGESNLVLRYRNKHNQLETCHVGYIEGGGMYHVVAEITNEGTITCRGNLAPIFSRLIIAELF